jgi:hypothetical protein
MPVPPPGLPLLRSVHGFRNCGHPTRRGAGSPPGRLAVEVEGPRDRHAATRADRPAPASRLAKSASSGNTHLPVRSLCPPSGLRAITLGKPSTCQDGPMHRHVLEGAESASCIPEGAGISTNRVTNSYIKALPQRTSRRVSFQGTIGKTIPTAHGRRIGPAHRRFPSPFLPEQRKN